MKGLRKLEVPEMENVQGEGPCQTTLNTMRDFGIAATVFGLSTVNPLSTALGITVFGTAVFLYAAGGC